MKDCEQLEQRFKLGTPVQVGRGGGCRAQLFVLTWDVPGLFANCAFADCACHCACPAHRACSHCCPADPLYTLSSRQATVLHVDGRKHALDVSLLPPSSPAAAAQPAAGTLLLGRVTAVAGGSGVRLQLSARSTGRVALTDIHDAPVQHALAGLKAGQYCRAAVLGPDPAATGRKRKGGDSAQLLLSLRPSAGGQCAAHAAAQQQQGDDTPQVAAGPLQAGQLKQGQRVRGVVRSYSSNCYIRWLCMAVMQTAFCQLILTLTWRTPLAPWPVSSASRHCWSPRHRTGGWLRQVGWSGWRVCVPGSQPGCSDTVSLLALCCVCWRPASCCTCLRPVSASVLPAAAQYYTRGVLLL